MNGKIPNNNKVHLSSDKVEVILVKVYNPVLACWAASDGGSSAHSARVHVCGCVIVVLCYLSP